MQTHGNPTVRGWLRLCVLLLGVFPAVASATESLMYSGQYRCTYYVNDTGNTGHPGYVSSNPSKGLIGEVTIGFDYARYVVDTYNSYRWRITEWRVKDPVTGTSYTRNSPHVGKDFAGSVEQATVGVTLYGSASVPTSWSNSNVTLADEVVVMATDANWLSGELAVDRVSLIRLGVAGAQNLSPFNTGKVLVRLTVQNNLLTPVTVVVDSTHSHGLNTLEKATWDTTVEGPIGNTVQVTCTDSLIWAANYDPIILYAEANPLRLYEREAHIGTPLKVHKVHLEVQNYSEIRDAIVTVKVVGWDTTIGTIPLSKWGGTGLPAWKTLDVNLELPPGSRLQFTANPGLTCVKTDEKVVEQLDGTELRYYVQCAEESPSDPLPVTVTATVDPNSGQQWLGVTDNTTGTTSIGTSTVTNPTNTDTSTTGAINSVTGGTTGTGTSNTKGNTYSNTSSGVTSAATQAMAADLGEIKADVDRLRANSDEERTDRETNLPAGDKAAVKNYLGQFANPSQAAASAMAGVQSSAGQGQTATAGAISSKLGAPELGTIDTPNEPNPGKLTLQIGPGKTVEMVLNPFAVDAPLGGLVRKAAAFIKRLIAWALVAAFFYQTMKEVRGACGTAFLTGGYNSQVADFVKSVNIFGWSVGVPVAAAVRIALIALVVTLVLTLPVALLAAVEGGLPWASLRDVYTLGAPSSGGGLGEALGYVDYVLPWHLMLSLPAYYIFVHNVLFPLQVFWQMIFKFLP